MILIDFLKKNKWNIIAILIFFIICVYYAYNKNIVASTSSLLCAILWLIDCFKKTIFFLSRNSTNLICRVYFNYSGRFMAGSSRMYSNRIVYLIFLSKET